MANSVSINSDQNNLWRGGIEPFKASYGKLMMWFFLISDAFTFSAIPAPRAASEGPPKRKISPSIS